MTVKAEDIKRKEVHKTLLIVEKGVEKNGEMADTFCSGTFLERQNENGIFPYC